MITELQAEGLITSEQVTHLEAALETARVIGAAVGVIMTLHRISQVEAFRILKKASMDGNRKLRLVAEEVVLTGHAPGLPSR
jgi:AmiR/NasT family two-component response regulator